MGLVILGALVLKGLGSLEFGLGLAWMFLPEVVVLGLVILQGLGVLGLRFLPGLGCLLGLLLRRFLAYLIHIPILLLGLGAKVALRLLVGLFSLLERQAFAWLMVLMVLQELW